YGRTTVPRLASLGGSGATKSEAVRKGLAGLCREEHPKRPRRPRPTTRALQMTQRRCPKHHFPLRSRVRDSTMPTARICSSPRTLPLRRTRTGVPGNGSNLSHETSPQVPSTGRMTSVGSY
ncbi:hypothetical protein Taro_052322, partial [Colocasia esculenta]|nr:hypothetical protein [Colocasia esculenta]